MRVGLVSSLVAGLVAVVHSAALPAEVPKLSQVSVRLEGMREKCLYEELPKDTVVLSTLFSGPRPC